MATIERQLQQNLNKIESNDFKFSNSKTQCVHLCQLRKQNDDRGSGWGGGVWYSLFIKNLAHYSSHYNFGLFIKIRPIIH